MGFQNPTMTLAGFGLWDIVPFQNLIHFAVCGATAGHCVRPVWRNHSVTACELHSLAVRASSFLSPCNDQQTVAFNLITPEL